MNVKRMPPPAYCPPQRREAQSICKPAAPPVYRGNQSSSILRSAPALLPERKETRPAPPVYRPQLGNSQQSLPLQPKVPSPPPVYRPGATAPNAAKVGGNGLQQATPAVYRPQQAAGAKPGGFQSKPPPPPVYQPGRGDSHTAQPAFSLRGPQQAAGAKPGGLLSKPPYPPVYQPVQTASPPRLGSKAAHISGPSAVQPYFVIPAERIFSDRQEAERAERPAAFIHGAGMFVGQELREKSFLSSSGGANVQALDRPALRVSDDCEMAIEDSNLKTRQPKTFFATKAALGNAQRARAENADYELLPAGGRLSIWNREDPEKVLSMVFPQSRRAPVKQPLDFRTPEACDQMVEGVAGSAFTKFVATCRKDLPVQNVTATSDVGPAVAELVATLMRPRKRRHLMELNFPETSEARKRTIVSQIAQEYTSALKKGGGALRGHLQHLQLNQFADPNIGETFLIASVARKDSDGRLQDVASGRQVKPKWPYHFATVVAKSGTDTVTLENYARNEAEGGEGISSEDPRWYFQMYSQNDGQSFHETWAATGEFANPVTVTMQSQKDWLISKERMGLVEQERARDRGLLAERAAYDRKVKIGQVTVGFLLLAIALGVMYQYGLYPSLDNLRWG